MHRKPQVTTYLAVARSFFTINFLVFLFAVFAGAATAGAQTIPVATVTSTQTLLNINGNSGHVAVNTLGDIFYVSQTDNVAYELKHGTATSVALVTGLSGGRSVAVDKNNNVYVPSNYSARIIEIPFIAGTYATGTANSSSIPACPATGIALVPCQPFSSGGSATGYYLQATDLAFDAVGNVYIVGERTGGGTCDQSTTAATCGSILKFAATNGVVLPATTATLIGGGLGGNLTSQNSGQIAVDAAGDVFYVDDVNLYEIPAGKTGAVIITPSVALKTPGGVAVDSFGNLYVTDTGNNRFVELPQLNGAPQPASAFVFSNTYSANGAAVDPAGRLIYTGYTNSSTNLGILTPWSANLGSLALGTTSSPVTLNVAFNGPVTPSGIALSSVSNGAFALTGGTCAAAIAYISGGSCTITATYTPNAVGYQAGAISMTSATGANLLTAYLSGTGLGAAQTIDPGVATAIGSAWKAPKGIALDAAKNVYVADSAANVVYQYAAGATTSTRIGTGLSGPTSVAVDGGGNVYIADSGNGRVVEVPLQNGGFANSAQTVIYTGTKGATGLAVDYTGSLYIADSGNSRVLRLTNIGGTPNTGYTAVIGVAGTTFTGPVAVATDSLNHIFVADQTGNAVYELTLGSPTASLIGSSLSAPSGLAIDPAGSLYIADTGNLRLLKIPSEAGTFNANDQFAVAQTIFTPYAVALDGLGNLYVSDSVDGSVNQVARTQGLLNLGEANLKTTTSQLTSQISSAGNQTLTFGTPLYTQTGSATSFNLTSPSTAGCTAAQALVTGYSCNLVASFSPLTTGSFITTLYFADNAANTSSPQLAISGVGTNLPTTTLALALATSGVPVIGQLVTMNATITSTSTGTPTGTISFLLDGSAYQHPVTVSGSTVSIVLKGLSGGIHTVGASYSGDANFAPAAAATFSFTVAKAPSSTSMVLTSSNQDPQSAQPGYKSTLTATVVQSGAAAPTGTVTFYNGTTVLGTGSLAAYSSTAGTYYAASATSPALAAGSYNITATYNGDSNYLSSISAAVPLTISNPGFIITPSSQNDSAIAGTSNQVNLVVQSLDGLTGYVSLQCTSGVPQYSSCSFAPNGFNLQGGLTYTDALGNTYQGQLVNLQLLTNQLPVIPPPPVGQLRIPGMHRGIPVTLAFLLFAPFGLYGRRVLMRNGKGIGRLLTLLIVLFAGAAAISVTGCSGQYLGTTPSGTYNITVTAILSPAPATTTPTTPTPVVTYTQTTTVALTVK